MIGSFWASVSLLVDATAGGAFQRDAAPLDPPRSGPDLQIPQWATAGEDVIFSRLRLSLSCGGGEGPGQGLQLAPPLPTVPCPRGPPHRGRSVQCINTENILDVSHIDMLRLRIELNKQMDTEIE